MSEPTNIIPVTPELAAELNALEARKQSILYGYLLAHGVTQGAWDISGNVLMRTDQLKVDPPKEPA